MATSPVYLWNLDTYDAKRVESIVGQSMDEMGIRPQGRVLVKPNAVIAHPEVFAHAFTRPEVIDGVLAALRQRAEGDSMKELVLGERRLQVDRRRRHLDARRARGHVAHRTGSRSSQRSRHRLYRGGGASLGSE